MQVSPPPPKTIILTTKMKRFASVHAGQFACVLAAFGLAGCGRNDVKVYKVDANDTVTTPPPAAAPAMPTAMPDGLPAPDNSSLPKLKYTLPDGWKEKNLTQMRVASFGISENGKTADVSVIPLGGMAGGDLANVNRWRKDVGQSALASDDDLEKISEPATVAGQPAKLFDLSGTNPGTGDDEGIVAAILHADDTAWFFKMTGDADLVKKNKPAFVAFLKSVVLGNSTAPVAVDMSQLPPSHPPISGMDAATPAADATGKPTWNVPADWKEGQLAQFLVAKFVIQNGNASAAVNVSQLNGDGGGLAANVNRWRAQLGQSPANDEDIAKLPTIDASGVKAMMVQINGTDARSGQPASLVGVVLPLNGQTWFYKLMGDKDVVLQQVPAFIQFVQSAKYPAAQ
jgi:hypothetical protein